MYNELEKITRREFIRGIALIGVGFFGLNLIPRSAIGHNAPKIKNAEETKYDISYLWHSDIEDVFDYKEKIEEILKLRSEELTEPFEREKLIIVKGKNNFGLVYEKNGDLESTRKLAKSHGKVLTDEDLDEPIVIEDIGYCDLYNISYGLGPSLETQKINFNKVWKILGPDVKRNLVIEKTQKGSYALVYKRYGDKESTFDISQKHNELLKNEGLSASIIPEQDNDIIYGESSFLDEEIEPQLSKRPSIKDAKAEAIVHNIGLEKRIEDLIKIQRKKGNIAPNEKTSWSVYDFSSGKKLVSINEDKPMQTASMVKPLVALAFFHEVEEGRLKYDNETKEKLRQSIQKSNNSATNWLIDEIGGSEKVQQILKANYEEILKNISIVEKIPRGGRTYKNRASAHDYSRFLYALWTNQLPYSREIRRLMALPKRNRLYTGASRVPEGTLVYDKTGSTARLCGDMGILVAKDKDGNLYPYTLVAIIQRDSRVKHYSSWITSRGNIIREVSNIVYDSMKTRYNL